MKWLLHALIGVFGYYLMGRLGLLLAIPPGFASSIWPAAGFALAASILLNRSAVIAGVGLGSFLVNTLVAVPDLSALTLDTVYVPVGIALGTVLQVYLLVRLYDLFIGTKYVPNRARDVMYLLLLIAPVGCFVSASVGAGTLYLMQVIPQDAVLFTWFTWWTGDTIGVAMFAPLFLVAFAPSNELDIARKAQVVLPVIVVFTAIVFLFFSSIQNRQELNAKEADRVTDYFFAEIEKRFDLALSRLTAFKAFYLSSTFVSEHEFRQFSKVVLGDDRIIKAVGWTPVIRHEDRIQNESLMRSIPNVPSGFTELDENGELIPARKRNLYYPVLYIHPFEENRRAYGLDLGHNAERLEALLDARRSGLAVATAPIKLAQETGEKFAFIVYVPLEKRVDIEGQLPPFLGYLSGVFRVHSMFEDLLAEAREQYIRMSIRDLSVIDGEAWLLSPVGDYGSESPSYTRSIVVGTRTYEIGLQSIDRNLLNKDWNSWWVMTAGVAFAIMMQSLILIITGNVSAVERLVRERTSELKQALVEADRANVAKSNFLSNISHELRTPLNAIINLIRMSSKTNPGQPLESYLYKANLASETLLSLINHTLDFNKIESGRIELERVEFNFLDLLEKIYVLFSMNAQEKSIELMLHLPTSLPEKLIGDPLRLEQVLTNICSNAIKFTEQGKVEITLSTEMTENELLSLQIEVRDTGLGISPENQARLFQPFQQADDSTTRRFGGSGLGLSISKRLIELMGGEITLTSEEGSGSTFFLAIPFDLPEPVRFVEEAECRKLLDRSSYVAQETKDLPMDSSGAASPELNESVSPATDSEREPEKILAGHHILVVEDVEMNQFIAQHMLENAGAIVSLAGNGQEALDQVARDASIELILMDIQMPVMDGYEATRLLRERYDARSLPIIAMTANAMQPDVERCLVAGMNDHIGKPIDEASMVKKIRDTLS